MTRPRRLSGLFRHPARVIVAGFTAAIATGGTLLLLPAASEPGVSTSPIEAYFTATSAVCVTGLAVVDTGTHWSGFGELVILALIQVGGFGIVATSTFLLTAFSRNLGIRYRIAATAEAGAGGVADLRRIIGSLVRLTVIVEVAAAVALVAYFWVVQHRSITDSGRHGIFLAVSAFNNAGFSLEPDSLMRHNQDSFVLIVLAATIVAGALGLPVWHQIAEHRRDIRHWSLHAKITVTTTVGLLVGGTLLYAWFEWTNPDTLGPMSIWDSGVNAFFQSVTPRTAGFNAVSIPALREPSRLLTEVLMYIGGGSGSTAGGVKVTTVAVLGWVIWAEARGETDVLVFRRRLPERVLRQALTVALVAIAVIAGATLLLVASSGLRRDDLQFEVISALATVGLSEDLTPRLPTDSRLIIMGLMLLGRVGPMTLASALVARSHERRTRPPEEAVIIG